MNMIRNWVGQSTGEDFYELCDKYGILIWDEFFQPNPSDGPNPDDLAIYLANVTRQNLAGIAIIPRSRCGARGTKATRRRRLQASSTK